MGAVSIAVVISSPMKPVGKNTLLSRFFLIKKIYGALGNGLGQVLVAHAIQKLKNMADVDVLICKENAFIAEKLMSDFYGRFYTPPKFCVNNRTLHPVLRTKVHSVHSCPMWSSTVMNNNPQMNCPENAEYNSTRSPFSNECHFDWNPFLRMRILSFRSISQSKLCENELPVHL